MPIPANTSIKLDVHAPKKDAVVTQLPPVPAATEVAIYAETTINPNLTQSIVGTFESLHAYAQSILKDNPVTVQVAFGDDGDPNFVVDGVPGVGDCTLYIGTTVSDNEQSHFLDRTFKRLIERWLEESK